MRRLLLALAAAAIAIVPGTIVATPLASAASCSGVWVIVTSSVRCATSYSTGSVALASAGYSVVSNSGLICRIDGYPADCNPSFAAYWSYWHAHRNADGSYGAWEYSSKGAGQYHPSAGDAEGWVFGDGKQAPSVTPPRASATTAAASTTKAATATTKAASATTKAAASSSSTTGDTTTSTSTSAAPPYSVVAAPTTSEVTPSASPSALTVSPSATATASAAEVSSSGGLGGPAALVFTAGAVALAGVGVAYGLRRRAH